MADRTVSWAGALLLAGCSFDATGLGGGLLDGTGTDAATQTDDGAPHGSSPEPSTTTSTTRSHDGESGSGAVDDGAGDDTETGSGGDAGASGDTGDNRDTSDTTGDDTSGSEAEGDPGFCGDGIITRPEACEPTDLGDAACSDLGSAYIGEPTCTESCTIDYGPCCQQPGTACALGQHDCCGSCQLNVGLNLFQCT